MRKILRTTFASDRVIHCLKGQLWVTFSGCVEDYMLSSGEEMNVAAGRVVVIEALKNSVFEIAKR